MHPTTLAALTLIKLFSEIFKFSKKKNFQMTKICEENHWIHENALVFVKMTISKLIKYLINICWSCQATKAAPNPMLATKPNFQNVQMWQST